MNVSLTGGQPPGHEAKRSSENGKTGPEGRAAAKAIRAYTEIAKSTKEFYEAAFNQIVIILGGLVVVIGIFLFSEHKSFEDVRKRAESKVIALCKKLKSA